MQVASFCMRAEYLPMPQLLAKFAEDVKQVAHG
jgi:hypothetical protein